MLKFPDALNPRYNLLFMNLSKLPAQERPRERLVKLGPEALSLTELLAILLTTGTKDRSVLELAHDMVVRFGSLTSLLEASIEELMEVKGIGPAKAIQLKAAFGIALKTTQVSYVANAPIHAKEAYELVRHELAGQKQEMLMVLLKDIKGRLIAIRKSLHGHPIRCFGAP